MRLTEEQKQAIIDDLTAKLSDIINEPWDGCSELEYYEDSYGRVHNRGSEPIGGDIEEICADGLPGIPSENSEIYISAEYDGEFSFRDTYDPGDYWTPPSGGIEIEECTASITGICIEMAMFNPETDKYEPLEVCSEDIEEIINKVNEKAA